MHGERNVKLSRMLLLAKKEIKQILFRATALMVNTPEYLVLSVKLCNSLCEKVNVS
jgi:hypothetical protein